MTQTARLMTLSVTHPELYMRLSAELVGLAAGLVKQPAGLVACIQFSRGTGSRQ